ENYIVEAIESVLDQGFKDLELIIIDDHSTDSSGEIITSYAEKDSRIRIVFHDENVGISRTMNEAISMAEGTFIAFTASDDVWVEGKLEKQMDITGEDEQVVVWSEGTVIDAESDPIGISFTDLYKARRTKKSGDLFSSLVKGNFLCGPSILIKKSSLGYISYDEDMKYLADYLVFLDLSSRYRFHFIPEPLAMYRVHGMNTNLRDSEGWERDAIKVEEHFLRKYSDRLSTRRKRFAVIRIIVAHLKLGEREKARRKFCLAIREHPLSFSSCLVVEIAREAYKMLHCLFNKIGLTPFLLKLRVKRMSISKRVNSRLT
ncbi:MAG: glycosyltransferase, partial [Actinomycetia bacterium]|nr:glycosyltransferase [Actinomycetes bacterium]